MKKNYFLAFFALLLVSATTVQAQIKIPKVLNNKSSASGNGVSEGEAGQGVKEALTQGVVNAVLNLNKTDGFFGNQMYKMFLPEDAQKIEKTLRGIGLGGEVDKAILAINRGAEEAVGFAKPIFIDAIKEITITDALKLVTGKGNTITEFFQNKTSSKLIEAFSPSVKTSLDNANATKYYADIVTTYNKLPTTLKKVNPDLTSFVVGKTVAALFDQVAKEEANIRANPGAQASDLLKKVFAK